MFTLIHFLCSTCSSFLTQLQGSYNRCIFIQWSFFAQPMSILAHMLLKQWHSQGNISVYSGLDTKAFSKRPLLDSLVFVPNLTFIKNNVSDMASYMFMFVFSVCFVCSLSSSQSQRVCSAQPSSGPWGHLSFTATTSPWSTLLLW